MWLCKRHRDSVIQLRQGAVQEQAEVLVREAEKAREAQAAAVASVDSVHAEAVRLRDSRIIASELRAQMRENGWAERIALSMALRHKG
jgi:hypothetical protein